MDLGSPVRVIGCLLLGLLLVACGSVASPIPAKGMVSGQLVETTVDAEIARYFLENYLQGKKSDRQADDKIAALYAGQRDPVPSRDALQRISRDFSVDFAALFLADRLLNDACNKLVNHAFAGYRDGTSAADAPPSPYLVLFVPGWDYAENGHLTGADFAAPRRLATRFGLENHLVALPPTGSVEQNADALAADILRHSRSGKKIVLAGASSAGPAIHLALGERLSEHERGAVKAWLNLGGILQGSPLIDRFQEAPQRWLLDAVAWFKGWDRNAILSMTTGVSRARFSRLRIDSGVLVINYLGIPLSGQLSKYSADKYPWLLADGPNDGLTLLTDGGGPGERPLFCRRPPDQ